MFTRRHVLSHMLKMSLELGRGSRARITDVVVIGLHVIIQSSRASVEHGRKQSIQERLQLKDREGHIFKVIENMLDR